MESNMYAETEGIILKQVKAVNERRMVLLFSKKYGKISAGTSINERGRNRSALAMRPFTHGRYDLYKSRDTYHINGAEVVKAYYKIGEDVEKYMCASYMLEFTEKLLPENVPSAEMFKLVLDFFDLLETRKKKHMTVVVAFQLKAIQSMGLTPEMYACALCGQKEDIVFFGVREGGLICGSCRNNISPDSNHELIYNMGFDIIEALKYFFGNRLKSMEHIALNEKILSKLKVIIKDYIAYHLDIKELVSEEFLKD
jgi:DNA repair protein RecO (recombination protein O)